MGASSGTMPPRASNGYGVEENAPPCYGLLEKLVMLTPLDSSQLGIETDARTPQTLESLGIGYSPSVGTYLIGRSFPRILSVCAGRSSHLSSSLSLSVSIL